jgi:hypothetical protein
MLVLAWRCDLQLRRSVNPSLSARLALHFGVTLDCSSMEAEKDQAFSLQKFDPFETPP